MKSFLMIYFPLFEKFSLSFSSFLGFLFSNYSVPCTFVNGVNALSGCSVLSINSQIVVSKWCQQGIAGWDKLEQVTNRREVGGMPGIWRNSVNSFQPTKEKHDTSLRMTVIGFCAGLLLVFACMPLRAVKIDLSRNPLLCRTGTFLAGWCFDKRPFLHFSCLKADFLYCFFFKKKWYNL